MAFSSLIAVLFVYIFMPALWLTFMSADDSLDAHENGLALVASRNPFRETGPPANMAKLILLRHKVYSDEQQAEKESFTLTTSS
ncbi:hypothetical protein BJ165DRAFT_1520833 [Panaeolus papilionaceus]|nr:hypothetical protein BJ165DRAFT_1520833 [Panaeolus papilionaceus]